MSKPCEWCKSTSEKIDSLEYQLEEIAIEMLRKLERIDELRRENRELKNK